MQQNSQPKSQHPILLIDDCIDTGHLVRSALKPYEVVQVFSLNDASIIIQKEVFSVLLIDVNLPDGNGVEFCQSIVDTNSLKLVPKILLTAEADTSKKVFGLYSGADDYVVKPFSGPELKARVDARLRGIGNIEASTGSTDFFGLVLNEKHHVCTDSFNQNKNLELTQTEFSILKALIDDSNHTLTREDIIRTVWKNIGTHISPKGLNSHVSRLRKKLPLHRFEIESIYNNGYQLKSL